MSTSEITIKVEPCDESDIKNVLPLHNLSSLSKTTPPFVNVSVLPPSLTPEMTKILKDVLAATKFLSQNPQSLNIQSSNQPIVNGTVKPMQVKKECSTENIVVKSE